MSDTSTEKQNKDKVNELLNGAELLRLVLLVNECKQTKGGEYNE
jgi:hypothetical protein